jgi:A/G-specific adenine glycosylase
MAENGLPCDYDGWRKLPGVGDYTAAAVTSIAFGKKNAAVDGNILRVFARLTCCDDDVKQARSREAARQWVQALMDGTDVWSGDITQSLMELGALVCLPKAPLCNECPCRQQCAAMQSGRTGELPVRSKPKEKHTETRDVLIILDSRNRVLLRQRTERLLHRMYEFPSDAKELKPVSSIEIGEAEHIFTHIRWKMKGQLRRVRDCPPPEGCVWVSQKEWTDYAVPSAFRFFVKRLEAEWGMQSNAADNGGGAYRALKQII